ncbi:DUF6492 family protein [Bacteroides sp.]|uniref:DUF6492 family protein n=1 Tax=Bacteroides sp. TaxID=29523 RepID=UPI0026272029|nr:DUF6492 family protein [Bacteroides sp.]MDD3036330.1 DUF6492 family protein [Bacteroides sp.]
MNKYKILRKTSYLLSTWLERDKVLPPSDEPIDVVIPVIEKDLRILPLCLEAMKRFVTNRIQAIYLVSPDNEVVKAFCREHGLVFVDEATVLGYGVRDIHYILSDGSDRSGWIFQQLLKLSGKIGISPYFLVIDADHILLRPHTFLTKEGKTVFYRSREYHAPYYEAIWKLLGWNKYPLLSYVAHKMLFSREMLETMKQEIHIHTGKTWDQAVLSILDVNQLSCFSEYETYGNYYPTSDAVTRLFRNKSLRYRQLSSLDELVKTYSARYRAVTFPDYKNK